VLQASVSSNPVLLPSTATTTTIDHHHNQRNSMDLLMNPHQLCRIGLAWQGKQMDKNW
jgi:hypothetical protein